MQTLELESSEKIIDTTLYNMDDDEFEAYCYIISISLYFMKNGLSNNPFNDFDNIRLYINLLKNNYLSISGTTNGLNVSINDVMIQKSMTEDGYIKVISKISPYIYSEPKEVDDTYMNNLYFYRKISYIISLYFGEYMDQYSVNKFDISIFDNHTLTENMILDVKSSHLSKYNSIFGKIIPIQSFNNTSVIGSVLDIFTMYEFTDRVPVPYGIIPKDSFSHVGNRIINPEPYRLKSFRNNMNVSPTDKITTYLRGKISLYNY